MSGRKETCRRQTEVWLAVADVPSDALLMRDRYDDRPDVRVKRDLYAVTSADATTSSASWTTDRRLCRAGVTSA